MARSASLAGAARRDPRGTHQQVAQVGDRAQHVVAGGPAHERNWLCRGINPCCVQHRRPQRAKEVQDAVDVRVRAEHPGRKAKFERKIWIQGFSRT